MTSMSLPRHAHRSQHGGPVFKCLVLCEIVKTAVERETLQHF